MLHDFRFFPFPLVGGREDRRAPTGMLAAAFLMLTIALVAVAHAQPAATPSPTPAESTPTAIPPTRDGSVADQVATLRRNIDRDQAELAQLRASLEDPQGEYYRAETEFQRLDAELKSITARHAELVESGLGDAVAEMGAAIDNLKARHELARQRFDLAIEQRRAARSSIEALEQKVAQDTLALAKLLGEVTPTPTPVAPPTPTPPAPSAAATATPTPEAAQPAMPAMPGLPGPAAATPTPAPATATPVDEVVREAQQVAEQRAQVLQQAEQRVEELNLRVEALRRNLEVERRLRDTSRRSEENAAATATALEAELERRANAGESWLALAQLRRELSDAERRRVEARREVSSRNDRIDEFVDQLAVIQQEMSLALNEADELRQAAEEARKRLEDLQQPWSPRRIALWLLQQGRNIILIIGAMMLLNYLARSGSRHIAYAVARGVSTEGEDERDKRRETLTSVFATTANFLIWFGGISMILQEVGVPIAPLLGGAAVGGLAVAFGAQNLIRDYFTGFVIILENQYSMNDVVRIAGISGMVERITLRMTVLRDIEGTVHFIPNGEIKTVSNMTHGWSRAVFDVGVAYKEDVDRVIDTIIQVGRELRSDPFFKRLILEDLTMLGVDNMGDSAIIIKFFIKTRPLKQWDVKRAMLRRLKKRFDELGIEIPFPHRTVYVRREADQTFDEKPTLIRKLDGLVD